jgi:hypothetical protein
MSADVDCVIDGDTVSGTNCPLSIDYAIGSMSGANLATDADLVVLNDVVEIGDNIDIYDESDTFDDDDFAAPASVVSIAGHPFSDGDGPVYLTTDGTLPTGLAEETPYWLNVSVLEVGFAATPGGASISMTGENGGTHTITGNGVHLAAGGAYLFRWNPAIAFDASGGTLCMSIYGWRIYPTPQSMLTNDDILSLSGEGTMAGVTQYDTTQPLGMALHVTAVPSWITFYTTACDDGAYPATHTIHIEHSPITIQRLK